jgi:hypothetical protein
MSQSCRAMTECILAGASSTVRCAKPNIAAFATVAADFLLNLIAYNLIRIPKLVAA